MNVNEIIQGMRSGECELQPIISYYATKGDVSELSDYLDDKSESCVMLILYVVSELPMSKITNKMLNKVEEKLHSGTLSIGDTALAQEILDNDEYYKRIICDSNNSNRLE